jgi:hypothetical protein
MRSQETRGAADSATHSADRADVVSALLSPNCDASLALVRRTRYAVRDTFIGLEERRIRQRRNIGLALLALFTVLILLTPEIWNSVEDLLAGEHLADLSCQFAFMLLMLAPAMLAALAAVWKEHLSIRRERSDC